EPGQQKAKAKAKAADGADRRRDEAAASREGARPADEAEVGEEHAPKAETGRAAVGADGKPEVEPASKKVSGKAQGSNFAGRSPPGNHPWSTRFRCCKNTWVEKIHPLVKPGHYVKSQVHWWKYVLDNLDLSKCCTEEEIETRVEELSGLYAVPCDQKLLTGP
ncbi:unnamed protein product, partial [Symbiodinium sp. CCMP2456]